MYTTADKSSDSEQCLASFRKYHLCSINTVALIEGPGNAPSDSVIHNKLKDRAPLVLSAYIYLLSAVLLTDYDCMSMTHQLAPPCVTTGHSALIATLVSVTLTVEGKGGQSCYVWSVDNCPFSC